MRRSFWVTGCLGFYSFATFVLADEPRPVPPSEQIKRLQAEDPEKLCAAAKSLGMREAKDAIPALTELLKHRTSRVKWTAAETLWRLEHKGADLAPVYAELLTATEMEVRRFSVASGPVGQRRRPAVLLLAATLRDENFEVRFQAGQALANLGPFAAPALPALVRRLGDRRLDESQRRGAESEGVRTSPALPALIELADDAIPLLIETFRKTKRDSRDVPRIVHGEMEPRDWEMARGAALAFPAFGARPYRRC